MLRKLKVVRDYIVPLLCNDGMPAMPFNDGRAVKSDVYMNTYRGLFPGRRGVRSLERLDEENPDIWIS